MSFLWKIKTYIGQLRLLKKWANLEEGDMSFDYENYELTLDVVGIRNKKPVRCVFDNTEMTLRYSMLHHSPELGHKNLHIDLAFKCPKCDWFTVFGVPVPKKHFLHIWNLRRREGVGYIHAPTEEWLKRKEIQKRLKALGYW